MAHSIVLKNFNKIAEPAVRYQVGDAARRPSALMAISKARQLPLQDVRRSILPLLEL